MYDGALGTAPPGQGWIRGTLPIIGALTTQVWTNGAVRLDTTPVIGESSGYFNNVHPARTHLDRFAGFNVRFDVRVGTEAHVSEHRAGFSVIVVANDQRAIEIGFWTNEIWAQSDSPLFFHAESVAFDTSSATNRFELEFLGHDYTLSANGADILTGPLRDYSSFGAPYSTTNFIFWGDDTSSAAALIEVTRVSLSLYPRILWLANTTGAVQLAVDNLETGAPSRVEQASGLTGTNWNLIDTLTRTGSVTHWSGVIDENATSVFLRVKGP